MCHRDHVLAARLCPADGTSRPAREPRHEDLLDAEELRPEAPADVGCDDAHLAGLHAEDRREALSVLVRRLRREPERQPPVVPHDGRTRPRLERARGQPLADEAAGDHDVAAVEQRLVALHRVARADVGARLGIEQHVPLERRAGIDHDGERVVVHGDELGGVDTRGARLADDDRDDVAHEADGAVGKERSPHPLVEARIGGGWNEPRSESAAVKTWTPGSSAAAEASISAIRACAYGERTKVAWSAPGSSMFSTYWPTPRRNRSSSRRRIRCPIMPLMPGLSHTGRR